MKGPLVHRRGFTLIELLVSIAVLSMLAISLFNILNSTSSIWARSEQQSDAQREVRAAMDLMASDLRGMVRSSDFDYFFYKADGPADRVTIQNYRAAASAGGTLFFFSMRSRGSQDPARTTGELCGIGYYVSYTQDPQMDPRLPARSSYKLYRKLFSSADAATTLTSGSVSFSTAVNPDDIVASNVVNLAITPYWLDASGNLDRTVPADSLRNGPVAIDIEMTAFPATAAQALNSQSAWEGSEPRLQNYYQRNLQKFSTRVFLKR